jgi:tetratricopeptide (TPR) repeat protein
VPGIGLFILAVWGVSDLLHRFPREQTLLGAAGVMVLAACLVATSIQLRYWQNSFTLFQHAREVTTGNYIAGNCLGAAFRDAGQLSKALPLFAEAVATEPHFAQAQFNLGRTLLDLGDAAHAAPALAAATRLVPEDPATHFYLARALKQAGDVDGAIQELEAARQRDPDFFNALNDLAWIRATSPEPARRNGKQAFALAQRACELTGARQPVFLLTLATACAENGDFQGAQVIARTARQTAQTSGQGEIVSRADELLKSFNLGQAFRETN